MEGRRRSGLPEAAGAGGQAHTQLLAMVSVRALQEVRVYARDRERLERFVSRLQEQVDKLSSQGKIVPTAYGSRIEALGFRKNFLEIQAQTGLLSPDAYLDQLRKAIPAERAKAVEAKNAGNMGKAGSALKRSKIMQKELDDATAAWEG